MQTSDINVPDKMWGKKGQRSGVSHITCLSASLNLITECVMFRRRLLTRLRFTASSLNSAAFSHHTLRVVSDSGLRHAGGMFLAP